MAMNPKTVNPDAFTYSCEVSRKFDKTTKKAVDTLPLMLHLNFEGVSRSALISEATRNIVVRLQGQMRSATKRKEKPLAWKAAVAQYHNTTIKVAEILGKGRQHLTIEQRAVKTAAQVKAKGNDAVNALIAELQKSLKP